MAKRSLRQYPVTLKQLYARMQGTIPVHLVTCKFDLQIESPAHSVCTCTAGGYQ